MSGTGVEAFDTTVHKTYEWLGEIMQEMGWQDRRRAYLALRATLHALRDRLTVHEAVHLGAQLPMLVRGFYFEQWDPSRVPLEERREDFLARIQEAFERTRDPLMAVGPAVDAERVARAVLKTLEQRVSRGEIEDVKGMLPKDIRELWVVSAAR